MFSLTKEYNKNLFTKELKYLFKILIKNGDEARLVGGCVRNFVIGTTINDYDIATQYLPEELETILKQNNIKYFTIGKNFGTITAMLNEKHFEITTLRKDIKTDGRHAIVEFTKNYIEDASRRDFTFNAIYMDYNGEIYDYFNGIDDLKNGIIKFIGNSEDRIIEDNLRIMRFFRFYSLYCNDMNYKDLNNCIKHKSKLQNLSKERISEELYKILESPYSVKVLTIMQNNNILQEIFKTTGNIDFSNLFIFYSINKFINFEYNYLFIFCLLISRNNLNYDLILKNSDKKYIKTIINNIPTNLNNFEIKKLLFFVQNKEIVKNIIILFHCNNFDNFDNLKNNLDFLLNTDIPILNISGQDLIDFGFENNKLFSKIIDMGKNIFVENNFDISKNDILNTIKKININ